MFPEMFYRDFVNIYNLLCNKDIPWHYPAMALRITLEQFIEFIYCLTDENYMNEYIKFGQTGKNIDTNSLDGLVNCLKSFYGEDRFENKKQSISKMSRSIDKGSPKMLYPTYILLSDLCHNNYAIQMLINMGGESGERLEGVLRETLGAIYLSFLETFKIYTQMNM